MLQCRVAHAHHLVQILLPLYDNDGAEFGPAVFDEIRAVLTGRFGGLTAHTRAPARGLWKADDGAIARDDIVILEVMAEHVDRSWWQAYRQRLESRFRQDRVVIRAIPVDVL
jgi:hypothetical protein